MSGWAWRTSRHGMQISTVNRPSTSLKGPVKVPQKEQCGSTPHPRVIEPVFDENGRVELTREALGRVGECRRIDRFQDTYASRG